MAPLELHIGADDDRMILVATSTDHDEAMIEVQAQVPDGWHIIRYVWN